MSGILFTIGHSNHALPAFLELLAAGGVEIVVDVRSTPSSAANPQFNQPTLTTALEGKGLRYAHLGRGFGGRSRDPAHCDATGRLLYGRLAATEAYRDAEARVLHELITSRVALLCAEKDPIDCHRALMITRRLRDRVADIRHIHADARIESNADFERRLRRLHDLDAPDLFRNHVQRTEESYDLQSASAAFRNPAPDPALPPPSS